MSPHPIHPIRPIPIALADPRSRATLTPPAFPTAAAIMCHDAAGTADAARAHAVLDGALAALATRDRAAATAAIGRWENEGGRPAAAPAAGSPRVRHGRTRRAWAAHEVRQGQVADAVHAYTRILRQGGVPLAATLAAVASAVRARTTTHLSIDAGAAVARDAARSCLEAYFGP